MSRSTLPDDLAQEVRAIVASALHRPVDEVPLSARLDSDLDIDSMATIEINVALETRFEFAMPEFASPAEASLVTVEDLARLVAAQLADKARRAP